MYTLYKDIVGVSGAQEFETMKDLVQHRNNAIMKWLEDNNIGNFPKTVKAFERNRIKLEEYSKKNSILYMLFVDKTSDGTECSCSCLNEGTWKMYPTFKEASRTLYSVSHNETLTMHMTQPKRTNPPEGYVPNRVNSVQIFTPGDNDGITILADGGVNVKKFEREN